MNNNDKKKLKDEIAKELSGSLKIWRFGISESHRRTMELLAKLIDDLYDEPDEKCTDKKNPEIGEHNTQFYRIKLKNRKWKPNTEPTTCAPGEIIHGNPPDTEPSDLKYYKVVARISSGTRWSAVTTKPHERIEYRADRFVSPNPKMKEHGLLLTFFRGKNLAINFMDKIEKWADLELWEISVAGEIRDYDDLPPIWGQSDMDWPPGTMMAEKIRLRKLIRVRPQTEEEPCNRKCCPYGK